MNDRVLKTNADDLYELVRSRKRISVEEAARALKLKIGTVQALVDFLVEEKIFGIEYKFTTPYVYISKENPKETMKIESSYAKSIMSKEDFFQKARQWKVSFETANELWNKYVRENLEYIKQTFYKKAHERNIAENKIDELWEKYLRYLR